MRLLGTTLALLLTGITALPANGGGYGYYHSSYYPSYGYYQPAYSYYPVSYSYAYYPEYTTAGGYYYPAGNYAYYNGNWYMQGYSTPYQPQYVGVKTPAYSEGWKTALLAVAKARDDQAAYLKALQALGLQPPVGPVGPQGTLTGNFYPPYGYANPHVGTYGTNGNTVYGYTLKSVQEAYGNTDMNVLYQQAFRLGQGGQQLAQQVTDSFMQLTGAAGENQAAVARILAEGQARAALINSSKLAPSSSITTTVQGYATGQQSGQQQQAGPMPPVQQPGANNPDNPQGQQRVTSAAEFLKLEGPASCVKCHGGQDPKGGFKIADYPNMDFDAHVKVIERIFSTDPKKVMPPPTEPRLTPEGRKNLLRY